jgi:hypothetical protein
MGQFEASRDVFWMHGEHESMVDAQITSAIACHIMASLLSEQPSRSAEHNRTLLLF